LQQLQQLQPENLHLKFTADLAALYYGVGSLQ
jgi:hypothetical protein